MIYSTYLIIVEKNINVVVEINYYFLNIFTRIDIRMECNRSYVAETMG